MIKIFPVIRFFSLWGFRGQLLRTKDRPEWVGFVFLRSLVGSGRNLTRFLRYHMLTIFVKTLLQYGAVASWGVAHDLQARATPAAPVLLGRHRLPIKKKEHCGVHILVHKNKAHVGLYTQTNSISVRSVHLQLWPWAHFPAVVFCVVKKSTLRNSKFNRVFLILDSARFLFLLILVTKFSY